MKGNAANAEMGFPFHFHCRSVHHSNSLFFGGCHANHQRCTTI